MAILVTGATGFLGSEIVPLLLKRGHKVYALSRHPSNHQENLVPLQGDITKVDLGLSEVPKDIHAVFHMAAMISFDGRRRNDIFQTNYNGTLNVLNLCLRYEIPRLYYVSTLYICGDAKGSFAETDFNVGQKFRNDYEQSKYLAEALVREFANGFTGFNKGIRTTIYRPSVIVGRLRDGKASSFEGFYQPMSALVRVMHTVERNMHLPKWEWFWRQLHLPTPRVPIRAKGNPNAKLSLIPIDYAARAMVRLMGAEPRTYHITSKRVLTNKEIADAVQAALGIQGLSYIGDKSVKDPLSLLYNRMIKQYIPYLFGEPDFLSSVDIDPPVDKAFIERIVKYWRENGRKP